MKRPAPLPAPPVSAAPARPERPGQEKAADPDVGERAAPTDAAPALPAAVAEPAARPLPEGPERADDDPVRLRDVWAASRARRKALRAEVRRFTGRARRRRAVWITAAASVVVLAVGTLAAAYSPLFAVEQVTVVGADRLDAEQVEAALADQLGTPLPLVDESVVKESLVAFPLIETYSLEARPPHELVLRIVERTPVGVVRSAAGYTLVDAAGVALSTTQEKPKGQPVIDVSGGLQTPAFEAVGMVIRSLPKSIRQKVTKARATTPDDVVLSLGGTSTSIVWGSAEKSAMKALVLRKMMKRKPPSRVSVYDVSSPEAVVVR
ncbi:MAG: FtsQ-type POTRA domain-containing protein [Microbacterium sp.]|uniref:FtsQ-type POTRA domain-containing protein n=1 Tax=Microbacterium sp. TaxID=51671 RepID=UPI0039E5240F